MGIIDKLKEMGSKIIKPAGPKFDWGRIIKPVVPKPIDKLNPGKRPINDKGTLERLKILSKQASPK